MFALLSRANPKSRIICVCFLMAAIAWGSVFYGHSVYLKALTGDGRWSIGQISTGITIFWISSLPGTLFVGYLIDKKGASWVVFIGAFCIGFSLVGISWARDLWLIFVCYGIMGFAYPTVGAAAISATLSPWFFKDFGWALGLSLTGASVGGAIIPPIMTYTIQELSFPLTMIFVGGIVFCILCMLTFILAFTKPVTVKSVTPIHSKNPIAVGLFKQGVFWRISIAAGMALAGQVGFLAHQIPIALQQTSEFASVISVTIVAISAAIGRLMTAFASRLVGVTKIAAICYAFQGVGILIVSLSKTTALLWFGCSVAGLVVGAIVMLSPMLVREAFGSTNYGKNYAAVNVILYLFAAVSPWFLGHMFDHHQSYAVGLMTLFIIQIVAAVLILPIVNSAKVSP